MKLFILFSTVIYTQVFCLQVSNHTISNQLPSINQTYLEDYLNKLTQNLLNNHFENITQKLGELGLQAKNNDASSISKETIIQNCMSSNALTQNISNAVNEQVKKCATIVLAQYTNVITNSYNEVQIFMKFPSIIWKDIQKCGLDDACRWQIVNDAIQETYDIPPKVFSLTAKIQSLVAKTIKSIDSCAIDGLKKIADIGIGLAQQVFQCIADETVKSCLNSNKVDLREN